eukprot:GILJ01000031.1.p1 GENE.GILJ01000031.1~~GILJ01000031.1.p1  ORF type:complete len:242 (-),score=50.79 GILJ01000031.1:177-845(-)
MVKHNNVVPNAHFHKDWQLRVKTWFNQAGKKKSRRLARQAKAAKIAPRPLGSLRPVVHGQTIKYNAKLKFGRGFSLEELKEAGITRQVAKTIGICVDHRRRNRTVEGLQQNVQRLKTYKSKLVLFPTKRIGKPKTGDSTPEELKNAAQLSNRDILPMPAPAKKEKARAITADEKKERVFPKLRLAHINARYVGVRAKKAKEAAEEGAKPAKAPKAKKGGDDE